MKKLLSVLTAAICLTACAFSFASCGDDNQTTEHTTHNWSATYTEDGDRHYQTCDGCDEKKYSSHDYGAGGVCVCGKHKPETPVAATGVTLNKNTLTLEIGGMATLTATVSPENATDKTVTWESDKTNIATVDNTGKVTAIKDGTAVITVKTANGKTATCTVTVNAAVIPVTGVTLNKTEITLEIGDEDTLTATVAPDNATDKTVTYSAAPAGIVTVDNTGKVTAIKDGTATITATTANNKTATCTVTVNAPITNAQVVAALDTYCKENAVKAGIPSNFIFDKNNISNGIWYITTDDNEHILQIEYGFNYTTSDGNGYYVFVKLNFAASISVKNLVKGTLENISYSRIYRIGYLANIQETRGELCNAICETTFETNGTLIARYIVDDGFAESDSVLTGTVRMFRVVEVTDKGVQQANVNIKTSSDDAAYIARLQNENDYRVFKEVSYTIVGTKLENNNEPF